MLEPDNKKAKLEVIHNATRMIEGSGVKEIVDIIPAYDSITLITKKNNTDIISLLSEVSGSIINESKAKSGLHKIKTCYELGLDWDEVETNTGIQKEEITAIHCSKIYTIAMTGFLPGFIFLDGLDDQICTPRKKTPRTSVPAGSIGIGGNQTGIYSLESPGGWQIIGRTTETFFDINENPPMQLQAGDKVEFVRISKEEFKKIEAE